VKHAVRRETGTKCNCQSVIPQGRTILPGTFNAHPSQWDLRCRAQHNAAICEGVIDEYGQKIGTDGRSTPYWTREDDEGELVIDLILMNQPIMKWTVLADDHATGSNHEVM